MIIRQLAPNTLLQERYQIIKLLGKGGYGAVYMVQDLRLGGKLLALKECFNRSAAAQEQFKLEARLLANLKHPSLPAVSDYFLEPSGQQYLVMDYVAGQDLAELLTERQKPVSEAQAVEWMSQVCDAVAYLHNQEPHPIIHRDIKPANIKIHSDGRAILVDFGIAKLYHPQKGTAKIAQAVSVGFSPPEQYAGGTDKRSDVYGLGATFYSLVTAKLPPDAFERMMGKATLVPPRQYNPQLSPALEQVILKAMEIDGPKRYPSGQAMLEMLRSHRTDRVAQPSCSACGKPNRATAKFCRHCGTRLKQQLSLPFDTTQGKPTSSAVSKVNSGALNFEIGNTYARNNELDLAILAYQQARTDKFTQPPLYHNLGSTLIQANRTREAVALLKEGLQQHPEDGDINFQLGRAFALEGRLEESKDVLEQAKQISPKDEKIRIVLGQVYFIQNAYKSAVAEFERAVTLKKDLAVGHYMRGKCYLFLKQPRQAEAALNEAIRFAPEQAEYYYYLGIARHHQQKEQSALEALARAIELDGNYFMAIYTYGQVHIALREWQAAIPPLEKAAALKPDDPDSFSALALCYGMLSQREQALTMAKRALAIDSNHQQAQMIISRLTGT